MSVPDDLLSLRFEQVVLDSQSNLYVVASSSSSPGNRIYRIDHKGVFTLLAGFGSPIPTTVLHGRLAIDPNDHLIFSRGDGKLFRLNAHGGATILLDDAVIGAFTVAPDNTIYYVDRVRRNTAGSHLAKVALCA